uniref:NADH-ubiquinone oxidoreductase chain 2 n=1 Tax=Dictyla platyoma TaxID=2172477 RepID=A0A343WNM3_9HEMI|nr:NADH dehydrogenase subunit 2 [Dictyla platyoma]AWD31599.1 NADH dehydrogenase subunit 2 [Dictyla platyoma]
MKMYNKKKLFLIMILLSTMMMMSSTKWLSMWLAMEINLMMTIPLIFSVKNKEISEKTMIYFLTQTMASILFLMMVISKSMNMGMFFIKSLMTLSMMIKLGVPPFHLWMPEMLNKMNWMIMFIMITIQKINPLMIISQLMEKTLIFPLIMIVSSTLGSISGINQISMNKIMAFSSINHLSWIMMCMMNNNNLWMKYFLIYMLITLALCTMFNKNLVFFINQMNMNLPTFMKVMIMLMMLNLGGLPPLPGFFMKWMTIESILNIPSSYLTMTLMMFSSMITLLFYMRMSYYMMMTQSMNLKFMLHNKNYSYKNLYILLMMNLLLPMMILV